MMARSGPASDAASVPLMEVRDLAVHFPVLRGALFRRVVGQVKAVDGVSLSIQPGEVLGLVGESGCGKTTIARSVLKLVRPTSGHILFDGEDIWSQDRAHQFAYRRRVQAVFQDPFSSLNPRMKVRDTIGEPFRIHRPEMTSASIDAEVNRLLDLCGLPQRMAARYPHEMSGGQRQRVGIARALALNAEMIVCDEAVSALDVSIQAQIINLLMDLKKEFDLTYLFIGHDLSVVKHLCDRVAVMYLGHLVELADSEMLFDEPLHPYTGALLAAVPVPDPVSEAARPHFVVTGEIPSPLNPPRGCVFHPRCPLMSDECTARIPPLIEERPGHHAACIHIEQARTSLNMGLNTRPSLSEQHENPL